MVHGRFWGVVTWPLFIPIKWWQRNKDECDARGNTLTHSVLSLSDSLNSLPQNHPPTLLITSALKISAALVPADYQTNLDITENEMVHGEKWIWLLRGVMMYWSTWPGRGLSLSLFAITCLGFWMDVCLRPIFILACCWRFFCCNLNSEATKPLE